MRFHGTDLAWVIPSISILLGLVGFLIRVLIKYYVKTLEKRLTKIDGGDDVSRGQLFLLENTLEKLENKIQQIENVKESIELLKSSLTDLKRMIDSISSDFVSLRIALPKKYITKLDCAACRQSMELHLQNIIKKVDGLLQTLGNLKRG